MSVAAYGEPGAGSNDIGMLMVVFLENGKQMFAQVYQSNNMLPEDYQKVADAFASIPGCTYAAIREGAVVQRDITPDRAYEPAPDPEGD
ncbi:hypothetical protein SEA_HENOCCUS_36 [Streptomyces phage Henoccus]|nr:hypothetical protein SEA_HENOCCUS_36 [Streptomyces phage Henoccus]